MVAGACIRDQCKCVPDMRWSNEVASSDIDIKSTRYHVSDSESKMGFDRFHVMKHIEKAVLPGSLWVRCRANNRPIAMKSMPPCSLRATSRCRHARRARKLRALRVAPSALLPCAARGGHCFAWAMGRRMPPAGAPGSGWRVRNFTYPHRSRKSQICNTAGACREDGTPCGSDTQCNSGHCVVGECTP